MCCKYPWHSTFKFMVNNHFGTSDVIIHDDALSTFSNDNTISMPIPNPIIGDHRVPTIADVNASPFHSINIIVENVALAFFCHSNTSCPTWPDPVVPVVKYKKGKIILHTKWQILPASIVPKNDKFCSQSRQREVDTVTLAMLAILEMKFDLQNYWLSGLQKLNTYSVNAGDRGFSSLVGTDQSIGHRDGRLLVFPYLFVCLFLVCATNFQGFSSEFCQHNSPCQRCLIMPKIILAVFTGIQA